MNPVDRELLFVIPIYARVRTTDKSQDPDTRLMPMRDFCKAQGWEVWCEYVDWAPADDLAHRVRWRDLLGDAAKKRIGYAALKRLLDSGYPPGKSK